MQHSTNIQNRILAACRHQCRKWAVVCLVITCIALTGCVREPDLHLHNDGADVNMEMPAIDLDLRVVWNYLFKYGVEYDWESEWTYGWDDTDESLFGKIGYTEPAAFNVRRYFTGQTPLGAHSAPYTHHITDRYISARYEFGYWDLLAWNDIQSPDGVQSVRIDETSTYDYVTAYTGQTMNSAMYNAPQYTRSFYQPEELFAGYDSGIEINKSLDGFTFDEERNCWVRVLEMELQPVTYIYLVQVVLHNNNRDYRKVTAIDGNANLSGMARSVNLNTGVTGSDAVTVNFSVRMKQDLQTKSGEQVDVIGGKVLTFGMPKLNPHKLDTRSYMESLQKVADADTGNRHYVDVNMQFYNGKDSTLVFDVTDQVRRLFRGGVITIDLDMDKVPIPSRPGGSGFDAVVKDWEEKEWEFDM